MAQLIHVNDADLPPVHRALHLAWHPAGLNLDAPERNFCVEGDAMQIRSKTYLQMISRLRELRVLMSSNAEPVSQEASPLLIFIALTLALLLAVLELDQYGTELQALGITAGPFFPGEFAAP